MTKRARKTPPKRIAKPVPRASSPAEPADPLAKPPEELASLLSRGSGMEIQPAWIRADVKAGAPRGKGGKVNLLAYAGWLMRESASAR